MALPFFRPPSVRLLPMTSHTKETSITGPSRKEIGIWDYTITLLVGAITRCRHQASKFWQNLGMIGHFFGWMRKKSRGARF